MDAVDFRRFALTLPETTEGEHAGRATFLVRGRRFATLGWPEPHQASVALSPDERDLLLATCPRAVEQAPGAWGQRGHIRLNLDTADDATARSVVVMAWRRSAPAGLVATFAR